ncbi:IS701 family transposase [Azospirillum argentinense]|uniref:IS701 family transposase n=1 Tax=Azospirillum argentinense TaxID=2970906 RepID=UPI0032DF0069
MAWLWPYLDAFSGRTRSTAAAALAVGAVLAVGPRTVTNLLRTLGLAGEPGFATFHRVLNRNAWSGLRLARTLLNALIQAFVPDGPIVIGVDHTLERRRGPSIRPASHCYDSVRSSTEQTVTSRGLRWMTAMLLVEVPFAGRIWGLPVLSALAPSRSWCEAQGRRYRPTTAWARAILLRLHRWLPGRRLVAVMDGEFAALTLLDAVRPHMIAITRLRLDARLFDPPPDPPLTLRQVAKGARQPSLRARLTDPATVWHRVARPSRTRWRTGGWIEYACGTALWHHQSKPIVPILWVMVRDPDGWGDPEAFLCTDLSVPPPTVLEWFNRRWAMETTYQESRAHLGIETQRQWADAAVFRTAPLLFGLYSLVTLYVHQNPGRLALSPRRAIWYPKPAPTFADALARLRRHLWFEQASMSVDTGDMLRTPPPLLQRLVDVACHAP